MLQIVMLLIWLIAFAFVVYLITQAVKHRLWGRRRERLVARKLGEFRKYHLFDPTVRRWVRKRDKTIIVDEAFEDRWFARALFAWLLLIVWEVYWVLEIVERFSKSTRPLELPYVFLFFVLFGVPLGVYLFFRWRMRRSARLPDLRQ
jgi:Ca2+/Na+ antiporter